MWDAVNTAGDCRCSRAGVSSTGSEVALADAGDLEVGELPEPSVAQLQVTATGRRMVLLPEGDLLGGWQDRVAVGSRLMATRCTGANLHHEPPNVRGLEPMPGRSGVSVGIGGTPSLVELFATDSM